MALRSGLLKVRRLGKRSASTTKAIVTMRNESTKAVVDAACAGIILTSSISKKGEKTVSPTTPPKMATALSPI